MSPGHHGTFDAVRSHAGYMYRPPGMSSTLNGTNQGGKGNNSKKERLTKKVDVQTRLTLSLTPRTTRSLVQNVCDTKSNP